MATGCTQYAPLKRHTGPYGSYPVSGLHHARVRPQDMVPLVPCTPIFPSCNLLVCYAAPGIVRQQPLATLRISIPWLLV